MDLRLLLNPAAGASVGAAAPPPPPLPQHKYLQVPVPVLVPTSPVSRPTTPTAIVPSPNLTFEHAPGTKRRELRAVGQAHRDRQRDELQDLMQCVAELRADNHRMKLCIAALRGGVVHDIGAFKSAMHGEVAPALAPVFHKTSDVLAARLGVRYLTGAMALLLLEIVAARRNVAHCERRPRGSELLCLSPNVFNTIVARGTAQINAEAARLVAYQGIDPHQWVAHVLESMAAIHAKWAGLEEQSCVTVAQISVFTNCGMQCSSQSIQIAKSRRPKKCHKCGQERAAGSGHPRGFCNLEGNSPVSPSNHPDDDDDNMSIA